MLIAIVFIWCQLKYAAIIMIFYFKASFSAYGQNVWVSSTTFLLIIIKKRQIAEASSACVQSKHCSFELVLGEGKRISIVGLAPQVKVHCGQTPPAPRTWHRAGSEGSSPTGTAYDGARSPVMWMWLQLPILPLGGSVARPPVWAALPFERTIKTELLFPKGKRKL